MSEEDRRKSYSLLDRLSLEELQRLLMQEAAPPDGSEPDVDLIMAIMEVIEEKDQRHCPADDDEVNAAWKDFQENYQGQADAYYIGKSPISDSSTFFFQTERKPAEKRKRTFKIVGVAAAAVLLLCSTASALGFDVIQALAHWTAETFGFSTPFSLSQDPAAEDPQEDPFMSLRMAVADLTEISVVPNWGPEGTSLIDDITVNKRLDGIRIKGAFNTEQGQFTISFRIYDDIPDVFTGNYQKDKNLMEPYESGEITHYLLSNNGNYEIIWTNRNLECHIQGDLSVEELKKMVDSIYEV